MKANVAHISLNAGGGTEGLSVSVIKALSEMGVEIELSTFERPNSQLMNEAYGETLEYRLSKVVTLGLLSGFLAPAWQSDIDLHINTHGDTLPLFCHEFSKNNSITYCHYPIAGFLIDGEDKEYLDLLFDISSSHIPPEERECLLEKARDAYRQMIINSAVLTISEFSQKAIFKIFGADSTAVYPPVDTERFQGATFPTKDSRADDILVISRFHRSKNIENAIHLARLLKRRDVGRQMVVVGSISPDGFEYHSFLRKLIKDFGLRDFVKFETSAGFSRLVELMRGSKVYLHPLPGEPFGISTVEAMSAGMIPVVPDIGSHTEFVSHRYQFHTFGQGVDAVATALDAPATEHLWMSHRAEAFSVSNFIKRFKMIITEVLEHGKLSASSRPWVAAKQNRMDSLA